MKMKQTAPPLIITIFSAGGENILIFFLGILIILCFSGLFVEKASESEGTVVDGGKKALVKQFITVDTKQLKDKRAKRFELKLMQTTI